MTEVVLCRENSYYDSITLMTLSNKLKKMSGVQDAVVSMATPMNKELIESIGMLNDELASASSNDMLIAIRGDSEKACQAALESIDTLLREKKSRDESQSNRPYRTISEADDASGSFGIAVVSVAGQFAAREAQNALDRDMHVMLFSDNVSVEEELSLKRLAHEKNLLVMGPDCGTAILDGIGLCFANKMRRGNIGLVGASGTGLQELCALIDSLGGGITQVIGTGGRDLSAEIGGIMMLDGINLLNADEETKTIVVVSKPPSTEIAGKIINQVKHCSKPVVVCFIAREPDKPDGNLVYASSLEDAAFKSIALSQGKAINKKKEALSRSYFPIDQAKVYDAASGLDKKQHYLRGLFCGGTLAAEAQYEASKVLPCVRSNVAKNPEFKLDNPFESEGNCIIDMGDDLFTEGRPHPMISPDLRCNRIIQEALDPECAVILLDFEIGFGSNADPASIALGAITESRRLREASTDAKGEVVFVGYVQGTKADYQGLHKQRRLLEEAGVLVANSNLHAVLIALEIMKFKEGGLDV
ncbi:MAG: acyl-CoA synthetase FdrA [Eggerthellaceae bacterium]|jgi:FdrA protein